MIAVQAVVISRPGGPEVLRLERRELAPPGPGQVLVEVAAAGLNRADLLQRMGRYPAPPGVPADVPGLEYAGRIVDRGPGATLHAGGARVMGLVGGGAMASHLVVHERAALPVPDRLDDAQAAAVPEAFLTVFDALVLQAGVGPGDTVLVHAAGSGIGTAAIQLVTALRGRALGTSRTADKLRRCADLGLAHGVHVTDGSFAPAVLEHIGGSRVDVVLETVGGAYLAHDLEVLAEGGRIVLIGLLGGAEARLPLAPLLLRRARLLGSVLRSRPLEQHLALAQDFGRRVLPLLADGTLRPVVDAVLPMRDVAAAHERLQRGDVFGKLVLRWGV